jgi:phage terminase large subunit-like protein
MTSSRLADPATQYAKGVVAGKIIAGPHVRDACARHLRDLKEGPKRGLRWDLKSADRVYRYFSTVLRLNGGEHEGRQFELEPSQKFIVGSIFGWKRADDTRRFRIGFIEIGKGNGKTPVAAAIGHYMTGADGESRAETYAAATDKEQAGILFRDAVAMAKQSPGLQERITFSGGAGREYNIAYLASGSFFRPVSSESSGKGKSGFRPHCALLDEIHEHPTNAMVEFLRAGTKGRTQALIFMITNSGVDRTSVCFEYHTYACKVSAGEIDDDSFFGYVCALEDGTREGYPAEDPFTDLIDPKLGFPRSWLKANPLLGVTFQPSYLEEQVRQAKGMPGKESIVRRLNFCQWVDATNPWIDGDLWRSCEVTPSQFPSDFDLKERPCFLALDLSSKRDLTSLAEVWPDDEGGFDARVSFWTPADTLGERENLDRVPYRAWVTGKYLDAVPGRSIDYAHVANKVGKLTGENTVTALAFDQWRIDDFLRELDSVGVPSWIGEWDVQTKKWVAKDKKQPGTGLMLLRHGQGFAGGASPSTLWMPRSIGAIEEAVLKGKLRVLFNPVLRWNSASAVLESDATGSKKWEKRKSTGRIDGIVALSMALGAASGTPIPQESIYATEGIFTLDI